MIHFSASHSASFLFSATAALAVMATACWVDPSESRDPSPREAPAYGPVPAPSSSASSSTSVSNAPLLVKVDTRSESNALNAEPGQGVGVFVEYDGSGEWHVRWTCDTAQTSQSCEFNIQIVSEGGDLSSAQSEGLLAGDTITSADPGTLSCLTTTGSNFVGVRFAAPAGGVVRIDAAVGGVRNQQFFFFVQDGKLNGGYTGPLSNPLRFEAATP